MICPHCQRPIATNPEAWSEFEETVLLKERERETAIKEIAEIIGRTPAAVSNKLSRMGC